MKVYTGSKGSILTLTSFKKALCFSVKDKIIGRAKKSERQETRINLLNIRKSNFSNETY